MPPGNGTYASVHELPGQVLPVHQITGDSLFAVVKLQDFLRPGRGAVDMAQPLSLLAFYMIEPEVNDGLVRWEYYDDVLLDTDYTRSIGIFPVFKYYDEVK